MNQQYRFVRPRWLCLLICLVSSPASAEELVQRSGDWVVSGHEILRGTHIRLDGNLILPEGAQLTLEDCTLEVLGSYSREHLVEWKGGSLVTRHSTVGGYVNDDGVAIHTVFHLYDGNWDASDTVVQYSYGISFHWAKGRGVLRGTRLKAGPRPDAIILSGEADVRLVDCRFPIGLGVYVDEGGKTTLDLATDQPVTATYNAANLLPGVKWRLEMVNTIVDRYFVFVRSIGMSQPPAEVTLSHSKDLIVSLLGHNLRGEIVLTKDLAEPLCVGNVTLKSAGEPTGISMWAVYFSGEQTDLRVSGESHICELMHRGGKLTIQGPPGQHDLSIGCTTLELSGNAQMELHDVHLGRPLAWKNESSIGEATVAGEARLSGSRVSVRNVCFHTKDHGQVLLSDIKAHGTMEERLDGGSIELQVRK